MEKRNFNNNVSKKNKLNMYKIMQKVNCNYAFVNLKYPTISKKHEKIIKTRIQQVRRKDFH